MFPQLIAGPIIRYVDIEKELDAREVTVDRFYTGLMRFTIGLAKKTLLSNPLAFRADQIFVIHPSHMTAGTAWLGALLYTFQIYFDFSGYSDMAIGLGHMLGFTFSENFNLPYTSRSVREFWRRWHISLSSWFRDYVYIPLGGSRKGNVYLHLLIVFILTGLWHGASWNFIIWGLWHGTFSILERLFENRKRTSELRIGHGRLRSAVQHIYTMAVVVIGWVFFRCETIHGALDYLEAMAGILPHPEVWFDTAYFLDRFTAAVLCVSAFAAVGVAKKLAAASRWKVGVGRMVLERLCLIGIFIAGAVSVMASTYNPFIYFRF